MRTRPENDATLVFFLRDRKVLLGMKKRGFGKEKWNGYGGKPDPGESIEDCAIREVEEENTVVIKRVDLQDMGFIDFYFQDKPEWNQRVHIFTVPRWDGTPKETEEMTPRWFSYDELDFSTMWIDDKYWVPQMLQGNRVEGYFVFGSGGSSIAEMGFNLPANYAPEISPGDRA